MLDLLQTGLQSDLDPALAEPSRRVLGQGVVELREDPVTGLHHDPPHLVPTHARIVAEGVAREVLQLSHRFDAREPGADEHGGEDAPPGLDVGHLVGLVERGEHAVADQIASVRCLKPTACSARPGIGSVRDQEPAPTINTSYGTSRAAPPASWTVTRLAP